MEDIFVEIKSRYAEDKNDFMIKKEEFNTKDINLLNYIFNLVTNFKIIPDKDVLKCEGKLEELELSEFERARVKKIWQEDMVRKNIINETINKFVEENKEKLEQFTINEFLKILKNSEISYSEQTTSNKIMEENITLGIMSYIFSQIFENTKFFDKGNSLTFWSQVKEINLNKNQIKNLIILSRLIGKNKFQLSFLPLYDFNSDNEDIIGINVIFNIEK